MSGLECAVLPDGRAEVHVLLNFGDETHLVTPWHTAKAPLRVPAQRVAEDCGMPASELPGRDLTAAGGESGLHDFRLVDDPRL